jgi:COPII coat assembly protein SEC16
MSALDSTQREEPFATEDSVLGHWHPASRPDTESIPHSDTETTQIQHNAPVTTGDSAEPAPGLEDFEVGGAPNTAQTRVISELNHGEGQNAQEADAMGQPQQDVEDRKTAPRVISWAPPPASMITFEPPDLPSDEDEERLDPAWGIKRTDPAQILQTINRSASFPSFNEPIEEAGSTQDVPLPHSQAEDVMHHLDPEAAPEKGEEAYFPEGSADADNDDWAPSANDFVELNDVEPHSATDAEARFEEGIPLISADSQGQADSETIPQEEEPIKTDPFGAPDDEASFFDNFGAQQHEPHQPPPLDRKMTADVLDHLGSHPNDPSDSPTRQLSRASTMDVLSPLTELNPTPETQPTPGGEQSGPAADDPWAAALADDEFLMDDDDELLPDSAPDSPSSFHALLKGDDQEPDEFLEHLHQEPNVQQTPPSAGRSQRPDFTRTSSSNPYAPHQPSTSDLAQLSPTTYGNVGFSRPALAPMNSFQQQLQQKPVPPLKAESFVDQKGGYKSPYDLPMEIAKPRKRQQIQQPAQLARALPPPPPRTSSMPSNQGLQSPFSPTFPPGQGFAAPLPSSRPTPRSATVAVPPKLAPRSSFFEELPITSRPRSIVGQGRYTPQQNSSIPPPPLLPQSPPSIPAQPSPPQSSGDPYAQYQLRKPEKLDPYANVPLQVTSAPVNPIVNTRYSPNPTAAVGAIRPSPSPRYSPAPPPQAAPGRYASQPAAASAGPPQSARYTPQPQTNTQPPPALPFQPRTSSPLAYMGRSISEQTDQPPHPQQQVPSQYDNNTLPTRYTAQQAQKIATPPPLSEMVPPRRSQTQSPGKGGVPPSLQALVNSDFQRPASLPGPPSPTRGPPVDIAPPTRPNVRQRGMTGNFSFIQPTDGQEHDNLQRWKGAPIFNFGFGGSVVSSFPKHVPRYAVGSAAPMIKSSAGEVKVKNAAEIVPIPEQISSFPGPLRSKSKKKEVLAWLKTRITALEQEHLYRRNQTQLPDPHKRHDEKVLLWKVVQALVEHDGVSEGSPSFQKAISAILSPEVHSLDDASATQYGVSNAANGIYRPMGSSSRTEGVDPDAVDSLRKHLLRGEREKAVWTAVDKRLWSHALLLASTLEPAVWKQVVQEFVRQEVKIIGNNTESLAALYEVFAGNFEESIDELVPPSARAGLQMVSKVDSSGPTKNALDGLDRWRETLSLVLSNRTNNDTQALAALGKLLMGYGRVEAAHICYLFARNPSQPILFAGADEPRAGVVLLGADHHNQATEFFRDEDAILLTEVYEFAVCVLAGNTAATMPYVQVYKLQRASSMADSGRKAEAQAYCEAIAGSFKATTKMSPYYNTAFFAELEELSSRLKQVPIQSSSSWAKPSVEKFTNSIFNRIGSFVAGDDSDADSKGSGKDVNHEFGPFANVSGTPSLSRTGSTSDLYGGYPTGVPVPTTAAGSRYAPNGANTTRSSSELTRGRPSLDSQTSRPSSGHSPMHRPNPYEQSSSSGQPSYLASQSNMYQPMSQSPPVNRYQATPPQTSYMPQTTQESPQRSYIPQQQESYIPTPPPEPSHSSYMPTPHQEPGIQPAFGGYAPPEQQSEPEVPQPAASNGYEGPAQSFGGYEPPSGYVPYEPEPDSPEQKTEAPQKKSYMDDDDDFPRVSNNNSAYAPQTTPAPTAAGDNNDAATRKRERDAAADTAFRAAAEADAAKANEQTLKPKASGWFSVPSVPFFGKKDPNSLDSQPASKGGEPKVHRANLGESKMTLYYDDKLKKWVNPADPESSKAKPAPPPPPMRGSTPMGGPPQGVTPSATMPNMSGDSMGMGNGPPSRVSTPADNASGAGTPPPTGLPSGLAPPSRPATGHSDASSLDDLLGPATGGRRTVKGKKGGKGGRYIDIMAK